MLSALCIYMPAIDRSLSVCRHDPWSEEHPSFGISELDCAQLFTKIVVSMMNFALETDEFRIGKGESLFEK